MIKEVKYNGFTTMPSDYESPDGDLAGVMGLIPEDNALKPVMPPKPILSLPDGQAVIYIHETGNFKHYIIRDSSGGLGWLADKDGGAINFLYSFDEIGIYQVNAIGNTLVVLTSDGIHYFLWKGGDIKYLHLGNEMPECAVSFGLQGELVRSEDYFWVDFEEKMLFAEMTLGVEFSEKNKEKITSQTLAKVNKFIADKSTNSGKFIYPFLIRYAYRLYDGSLIRHSAPVLMTCSSDLAPQAFVTGPRDDGELYYDRVSIRLAAVLCTLDYAVRDIDTDNLRQWDDIIKSVDIFVSPPIYTYDQNGQCKRFSALKKNEILSYSVCKHINTKGNNQSQYYQYNNLYDVYDNTFTGGDHDLWPIGFGDDYIRLVLPYRDQDSIKADIRDCSQFYFLKSINISDLKTERTTINIPKDYLQSLVNREVMADDYDSHDKIVPQYSFAYNQRLNVANIRKQLFHGFPTDALFNYSDGSSGQQFTNEVTCYVYINQDGKEIIVKADSGTMGVNTPITFFYYPNPNAYKAVFCIAGAYDGSGGPPYYEVPLERHDFLNGAFYFNGWGGFGVENMIGSGLSIKTSTPEERIVNIDNKIYTSEINNPFYFPVSGINTLGTGTVLGICSAVKALSQGQFGQFPLYAFTTDGVWALELSDTGTYSARQPVSRDVCIDPASITQIDNAVLFATDRGVMLISGSDSICITDILNDEEAFKLPSLPLGQTLIAKAGFTNHEFDYIPFGEFLTGCRMIYDYSNQRIVLYHPGHAYAYVYSLKSKQWGMMQSNIVSGVNSYPDALAMTDDNKMVDFSRSDAEHGLQGLAITRPLKLDAPDLLKTIDTVIQRGYFRKGSVSSVLYGSRDLFNWHLIFTSKDHYLRGFRGTPYKYFRIAFVCSLDHDESLFGCTVQYSPRLNNQPR